MRAFGQFAPEAKPAATDRIAVRLAPSGLSLLRRAPLRTRSMKPTVVVLLSDKRSGSTQFERELCKHESVSHVRACTHSYNETHHWLKAAVITSQPTRLFSGARPFRGYGSRSNAQAYLIDQVQSNVPAFQAPEDPLELSMQGWEALCAEFANPVFFEKSPQHLAHWSALSLLLAWTQETEFRVRIIGLVRNPQAVMYSAWKLFRTLPQERECGWVEAHRNLLTFRQLVPESSFKLIKYEDMVGCPHETFSSICEFIGIAPDPRMGSDCNAGSLDKWKTDQRYSFQPSAALVQIASALGYESEEIAQDRKPTHAMKQTLADRALILKNQFRDRLLRPAAMRLAQSRSKQ